VGRVIGHAEHGALWGGLIDLQAHAAIIIKRFYLRNAAYCCNNSCKHNLVLSD
jgi:hypothetical protein